MRLPVLTLRPGREKPVVQRHPWIFSGAVLKCDSVEPGGLVDICSAQGQFLARGYANAKSKLVARALTWDQDEGIDAAFWQTRIAAACARRDSLMSTAQNACRRVMSEADQLPGLIVDQYGDFLVVQALTAGIDRQLGTIVGALQATLNPAGILERSDDAVRELEGLERVSRRLDGAAPPESGVQIRENGVAYSVDLSTGHKTGFYLDQRRNHALCGELAAGRRVLDCFSYTGGFTMPAALGGAASVLSIDASEPALAKLRENLQLNGFASGDERFQQRAGNAFELLRDLHSRGETFDMITLDPPKFAANGAQVEKAARGYKDINMNAFKLLRPGGLLLTYSCSGHISSDLFQKIVFGAALDAGRDAQIVQYLFQADDHPVLLTFPESLYLKGLLCRAL